MSESDPIPVGYCQCGCGAQTPVAHYTARAAGIFKGEHLRFIHGHNGRKSGKEYVVDPETECWVWQLTTRGVKGHQYGAKWTGQRMESAHRIYYERFKGKIPDGLEIDHLCRNPLCVNPDHLEAVSHVENMRRAAKLDMERVRGIRSLAAQGWRHTDIARAYEVTPTLIGYVVAEVIWQES